MTAFALDPVVARIRELEAEIAELTALLEGEKDRIKTAMVEAGEETLSGTGWIASWKTITSSRLDTAALKKAMPEVYETFSKASTTTRFTLR